jgi:hypothetical protein
MTIARAMTSDELIKMRANSQHSRISLAIERPATVFTCRANQTFTAGVIIAEIAYDTATGTYTDILPGMTIYFGSTAGAYDIGTARVRKAATSSVLYTGMMDNLPLADNMYITVVDEFNLWPRHWRTISDTVVYMDYDLVYNDENEKLNPVAVLGPDAVLWKSGSTVALQPDASRSWVLGSTITGYVWTAPGASATSGLTTATPTITYNAAGQYRIGCTVTSATGKSSVGYRRVFVFDDTHLPDRASVSSFTGDAETGGWSFNVTMNENAARSVIRDGIKVIAFATDYYDGIATSIGPQAGYQNIIAIGWLDSESVDWRPNLGSVEFAVRGPQYWLGIMSAYGAGFIQTYSQPTDWKFIQALTADKVFWNSVLWRSTTAMVIDVTLSGDTRVSAGIISPLSSVWSQLQFAGQKIFAKPICNRYGQMFIEIDTQYLEAADRASIPIVMAITKPDWDGEQGIKITRRAIAQTSMVDLSGTGTTETDYYFSNAPGTVFGRFGKITKVENILLASQTQANQLSGHAYAQESNEYPAIDIPMTANNRMIDIAPRQYVTLTVATGDTPRGIAFTNKKMLPRRVEFKYDPENGSLRTSISCEAETIGTPGVTVIPPKTGRTNIIGGGGTPNPIGGGWLPPWIPTIHPPVVLPPTLPPNTQCLTVDSPTGPYNLWISGTLPTDTTTIGNALPSTLRPNNWTNRSMYEINGLFYKKVGGVWQETLDKVQYEVYATDVNDARLATASNDDAVVPTQRTGVFVPAGNTPVARYRVRAKPAGFTTPTFQSGYGQIRGHINPTYTYVSFVNEIDGDGALHVTSSYEYSFTNQEPNIAYADAGIVVTFSNSSGRDDAYKIRVEMVFVMVSPIATFWEGPRWRAASSDYWDIETGSGTAYVSGDRITGEIITTTTSDPNGNNELRISLPYRYGTCNYSGTYYGSVITNAWITRNDGTEYNTVINSVYLRNICPG